MSAGRGGKVDGLRVPLFVLHACDDPVMHVDGLPVHRTEDLEDLFFVRGRAPLTLYPKPQTLNLKTPIPNQAQGRPRGIT